MNFRAILLKLTLFATLLSILVGGIAFKQFVQFQQISDLIENSGYIGYLIFIIAYVIATLLVLPSTAFNLLGGALFGGVEGLFLTSTAALISAIAAFGLARWLGKDYVERFIPKDLEKLNQQLRLGGISYTFASRLLPLIPYGVVSFAAGLSQIRYQDYILGTLLGTPLGLAPFVWLGSSGVQALSSHELLPLIISSTIIAVLIAISTWYQQHQTDGSFASDVSDPNLPLNKDK
jgi:uncharacterized membrane protein YdjX (TVP38/TMEM64 family)